MKILVIPDLHQRLGVVKHLEKIERDLTIYLGDYFDNFYDTVDDAIETAKWLKKSLKSKVNIHLWGNHDIHYRFPYVGFRGGGYSDEKYKAINKIMKPEDWDKLKLFYYYDGPDKFKFLFSHAGVHSKVFGSAKLDNITKICKTAIEEAKMCKLHSVLAAGASRGGRTKIGGITWMDFSEFEPIKNLNQIVGHTPSDEPRYKDGSNSTNICIDTHNHHYLLLDCDNKVVNIKETWK